MKHFMAYLFLTITLLASVNEGQEVYMQDCQKCHGSAVELIKSKDVVEWLTVFDNYYAKLIEAHLDAAPQSWSLQDDYRLRYKLIKEYILFHKGYYEPKPDTTVRRVFHGF